ncbi:peroxiredoxin [Branchiibius sp. NY16-3462-2]|uniref:peroxiredoxin n=1 Tax=Branchiibius sp. NY16-3462-2 TaxID=1807500 RepID=UPI000796EA1A|nr:peroxiredoxin [Branchiibius sp. NY16-3462-2]KYH43691.1 peroxiredoxin [Branchiibius sp. NY16-3462-2]
MSPAVGDKAPDFTLKNQFGSPVTLSEVLSTKAALIVFYPFAFSGICTGELCGVRDDLSRYQNDAVEFLAISCDPMPALKAWGEQEGYDFPLLSDFWPHGQVARDYGVFHEEAGFAVRGSFLVAQDGTVRWSVVNGPGEARDFGEAADAIAAL